MYTSVVRLVTSLSKSEKRYFRLYSGKQEGEKSYITLYNKLCTGDRLLREEVEKPFIKKYGKGSFDAALRYLFRVITDCLIELKMKNDDFFKVTQTLLRMRVLNERNLQEQGYREIKKLQLSEAASGDQLLQYFINRYELNYLSEIQFHGTSEKDLIDLQMKTRDILKEIRNTHEHNSLYEILKHRLTHTGRTLSEDSRKQLNDLMLSELSIMNAKTKPNQQSRKLHLLFQSYFFTNVGDYRSALKTFYELNRLFEKNVETWSNPPLDYFSSLDGTLDSLRTTKAYVEMPYFITRLEQLLEYNYPEHFQFSVRKTIMIYQLVYFNGIKNYGEALKHLNKSDKPTIRAFSLVDEEKQCELLFNMALVYFNNSDYRKALAHLNDDMLHGIAGHKSVIYRVARLLTLIIHYEEENLEYLDYEIRSFKRAIQQKNKLLKSERLVLKLIRADPDKNSFRKNELLATGFAPLIQEIRKDRYELQLLKHINLVDWIEGKLEARSGGRGKRKIAL